MSNTDIVREVDEEIRREQVERLWTKYRPYILGAAVAIVLGVAGYKYWQATKANEAATAGSQFAAATALIADGKPEDAIKALESITKTGAGAYPTLAGLRLAALDADAGRGEQALTRFEGIGVSATDPVLAGFAKLQAAQLRLDKADFTEMQNRLNPLSTPDGVWRQSARQLLGIAAYKAGKLDVAGDQFNLILADPEGRGTIGQTAEMMQQLIMAATAKPPGAAPAATDGKTN